MRRPPRVHRAWLRRPHSSSRCMSWHALQATAFFRRSAAPCLLSTTSLAATIMVLVRRFQSSVLPLGGLFLARSSYRPSSFSFSSLLACPLTTFSYRLCLAPLGF